MRDKSRPDSPCSITATGLGLACLPVAVEQGFVSRAEASERARITLRTLRDGEQSAAGAAMGHRGFYYHFLDMETGRRARRCELSTIDSSFLIAGALVAAACFDREDPVEREIRETAEFLYRRMDWGWALNGGRTVSHGWKPESGFLKARWTGYNEALLLYVLGLGSPSHPLPAESYADWTRTYRWKKIYGVEFLYAGPLFIHQLSHVWIDFRKIRDDFMRARKSDYFENSRLATYVQQRYAIRNPRRLEGYGEHIWGITASDGPGPARVMIDGVARRFFDYIARGVPWGPDDGTLSPWAVAASLPFAPEIVVPALEAIRAEFPEVIEEYGFRCSFNPTYRSHDGNGRAWISTAHYGLDQGPIVIMIENDRSGLVWRLMGSSPWVRRGLDRAGFRGGWLE